MAVLVKNHGDDPHRLMVIGCVSRGEFAAKCEAKERKYGTKMCMKASDLSPPESLWRFAVERAIA